MVFHQARIKCKTEKIIRNNEIAAVKSTNFLGVIIDDKLKWKEYLQQGWGQVQYLYLSTYLSVLDVLEYLVYGNVKVLVLVLDQKVLGT